MVARSSAYDVGVDIVQYRYESSRTAYVDQAALFISSLSVYYVRVVFVDCMLVDGRTLRTAVPLWLCSAIIRRVVVPCSCRIIKPWRWYAYGALLPLAAFRSCLSQCRQVSLYRL